MPMNTTPLRARQRVAILRVMTHDELAQMLARRGLAAFWHAVRRGVVDGAPPAGLDAEAQRRFEQEVLCVLRVWVADNMPTEVAV